MFRKTSSGRSKCKGVGRAVPDLDDALVPACKLLDIRRFVPIGALAHGDQKLHLLGHSDEHGHQHECDAHQGHRRIHDIPW